MIVPGSNGVKLRKLYACQSGVNPLNRADENGEHRAAR
jgi:hypothetical protein